MRERLDDLPVSVSTDKSGENDDITVGYGFDTEEIYCPTQLPESTRYRQVPVPEMLRNAGVVIAVPSRLDGESNAFRERMINVRYTSGYVVASMAYNLRLLLNEMSRQEWEDLMYKVYREGQSNKEKSEAEASK
jgi:hypothetical protein